MPTQDPFADTTQTLGLTRVGMNSSLLHNMDLLDQAIATLQQSVVGGMPSTVDVGTF